MKFKGTEWIDGDYRIRVVGQEYYVTCLGIDIGKARDFQAAKKIAEQHDSEFPKRLSEKSRQMFDMLVVMFEGGENIEDLRYEAETLINAIRGT